MGALPPKEDMVLIDTSVWIDFFHGEQSAESLPELLLEKRVRCHPWVLGELMLGSLGAERKKTLEDIGTLPQLQEYEIHDLKKFVEEERLYGKGISLVDLQLLYAALSNNCLLWTHDRQLYDTAKRFGIATG